MKGWSRVLAVAAIVHVRRLNLGPHVCYHCADVLEFARSNNLCHSSPNDPSNTRVLVGRKSCRLQPASLQRLVPQQNWLTGPLHMIRCETWPFHSTCRCHSIGMIHHVADLAAAYAPTRRSYKGASGSRAPTPAPRPLITGVATCGSTHTGNTEAATNLVRVFYLVRLTVWPPRQRQICRLALLPNSPCGGQH